MAAEVVAMKLNDPIYSDENKAREHLEKLSWPHGPFCPHCGNTDPARLTKLKGKSTRPGVYKCKECRKPFSVTVGTVMERSKIPLGKWLLAMHLMTSSKKGMSAHQLHRMLGMTYEAAWFMAHRLREAMKPDLASGPLGGEGKTVSVDETYIRGKAANRAFDKKPRRKAMVMTLVDHETGRSSSHHIASVGADTVREVLFTKASRKSTLVSDESKLYAATGEHYEKHETVLHAAREYVNKDGFSTNINENFFSLLKRGIYGVYHHVSPAHLGRYVTELDFRYSSRHVTDAERCAKALEGIRGKRLTYRQTNETAHA
jgi:transposase-like protein